MNVNGLTIVGLFLVALLVATVAVTLVFGLGWVTLHWSREYRRERAQGKGQGEAWALLAVIVVDLVLLAGVLLAIGGRRDG